MANNNTNGGGHEVTALSLLRQLCGVHHDDTLNIQSIQADARKLIAMEAEQTAQSVPVCSHGHYLLPPPQTDNACANVEGLEGCLAFIVRTEGAEEDEIKTLRNMFEMIRDQKQLPAGFLLIWDKADAYMLEAMSPVMMEMSRQNNKWGTSRMHSPLEWHAILGEEVGEFSRNVVDAHWSTDDYEKHLLEMDAIKELIEVAAVAIHAHISIRDQNG